MPNPTRTELESELESFDESKTYVRIKSKFYARVIRRCLGLMDRESPPTVRMADIERSDATCPRCGEYTRRRSIDGGLTSIYTGECGHSWEVSPFGKKMR